MNIPASIRTRWAAIGAAVAVSLGAGGVGLISATSPEGAAAFVPVTPCRLFDTRPDFQVGPRSAPLGENDTHTVKGTGTVGECTIPGGATGLVMNVTAIDATLPTFLAVWPSGEDRPNASHLNPAPDQPPTPNAVSTGLGTDDNVSIYNKQGNVHVFADVVGYFTDHHHDDRYYTKDQTYTKAEADALLAAPDPIPDRILVPMSDFVPDGDQTFGTGWGGDVTAPPPTQCLTATPDLPPGAAIEKVDVFYSADSATEIGLGMVLVPLEPGPISAQVLVYNDDIPVAATGDAMGLAEVVHDPSEVPPGPTVTPIDVVPDGEYAAVVQVCIDEPAHTIAGVVIDLA